MYDWAKRLRARVDEKGWSGADLARASGIGVESITQYLRGNTQWPRGKRLNQLADALEVSVEWLTHGVSQVKPLGTNKDIQFSIIPLIKVDMLFSVLQGADPVSVWPTGGETITVPAAFDACVFAVRLVDDSMASKDSPIFLKGDVVIFDPTKKAEAGSYVLARLHDPDRVVFREFREPNDRDGHQGYLTALNDRFGETILTEDKGWIIARAVAHHRVQML